MSTSGSFDLKSSGMYSNLMREMLQRGHSVCVACANQKGSEGTFLKDEDGIKVLRVSTGKMTKTNVITKGIALVMAEPQFKRAIKKHFNSVKFDLVIYATPPITFYSTVKFIKKRDNAKTYLLLKDIFPQNAVDIGMMSKSGIKGIIYKMFRKKEEKLYKISDYIGCMSQANVDYIIKHNPEVDPKKVHVNPNSMKIEESVLSEEEKRSIKGKYNIPMSAKTFIYGGNLGKPQDIPFVINCLKANEGKRDRFFIICGKGTEYKKLEAYVSENKPQNVLLINGLPKEEYDVFVKAFDIGLIFLDHRFTIPNFPSRLLSYMQSRMPVIACTDPNTDIGKVITEGGFGWWCESDSVEDFTKVIDQAVQADLAPMQEKAIKYLYEHYDTKLSCDTLLERVEK